MNANLGAADLTEREAYLLGHAAAMGGWLTASFLRSYDREVGRLVQAGLFVLVDERVARYVLTEAGHRVAAEIGDPR